MTLPEVELVVGVRPNFVKAAAFWRAFQAQAPAGLSLRLVNSGQHRAPALAAAFGRELGLPEPHVTLPLDEPREGHPPPPGQLPHGWQTAAILQAYEAHLLALPAPPRAVVVIGDVNSTLACALAAAKLEIPVVHLEAGLRAFDRSMPEELNRVLVDAMSDLLLASEPSGVEHLLREGAAPERVHMVGSLTVDTLVHELAAARALGVPARLGLPEAGFALLTLHRPSNVDDPRRLGQLVEAVEAVSRRLPVVFPVHPRTAARLADAGLWARVERALVCSPPVPYRDAVGLMDAAAVVITDSGGVQEETSYLGVPCLSVRANTERPITVEQGTNTLVGAELAELARHVDGAIERGRRAPRIEGWDGRAAERAVRALLDAHG